MGSNSEALLGDEQRRLVEEEEDAGGQKPVSYSREFGIESKKLWKIAGPAILTAVFQYSLGAITQTFAGQIGELDLAAFSVENSVVAGLAFGVMVRPTPPPFNFLVLAFILAQLG